MSSVEDLRARSPAVMAVQNPAVLGWQIKSSRAIEWRCASLVLGFFLSHHNVPKSYLASLHYRKLLTMYQATFFLYFFQDFNPTVNNYVGSAFTFVRKGIIIRICFIGVTALILCCILMESVLKCELNSNTFSFSAVPKRKVSGRVNQIVIIKGMEMNK